MAAKLPNADRWHTPIRSPPIDTFPQQRQLCRAQASCAIAAAGPRKTAPLKHLIVKTKALTIPIKQFQPVAPASAKGQHRPPRWLDSMAPFVDLLTGQIMALRHLGHRRTQPS